MIIPKDVLVENIKRDILDNSTGKVSPEDIRRNFLDLIDSVSNLTRLNNLEALNYSTEQTRTVRAGEETLSKRNVRDFSSIDNVAIGYGSSKSLIDGSRNTSVGSLAMQCNMFGVDNVGIGVNAVGSLINGYGNIGIGNYTINNTKEGNFNIAIGHAAGYYIGRGDDYKFFLASHPIDSDYICQNTSGEGLVPLLNGDLSSENLRLGVATRYLHDGARLQVEGNIHPSTTNVHNLGASSYRFKNLYLQSSIYFPSNNLISYRASSNDYFISSSVDIDGSIDLTENVTVSGNIEANGFTKLGSYLSATSGIFSEGVEVSGNIMPLEGLAYDLGDVRDRWRNAYIYNIYSDGVSRFNVFQAEEQSHFKHKTIYLASEYEMDTLDGGGPKGIYQYFNPNQVQLPSNEPVQYLLDEELSGAGFKLGSSGVNYQRTYELTFRSRVSTWNNLSKDDAFSRSHWFSNISIATADGTHVKTDRIINNDAIGMFTYDNDIGCFIESGVFYVAEENNHKDRSGLGNVNFIAPALEEDSYSLSVQSPLAGVNLFQTFFDGTSGDQENVTGFKTGYISDSRLTPPNFFNEEPDQRPNRYIISSYNNSNFAKRCFTLLQDESEGYVGISNFDYSESMLPDTVLNVRSTGNAVCRITAENSNNTEASIELLGQKNCLDYGVSMQYANNSGIFHFRSFEAGVQKNPISIDCSTGDIAILNKNFTSNAMLSVGDEDNTEAHISLFHSTGVPIAASGYGQIFTREVLGLDLQTTLLSFMDSSGNIFNVDVTASSADGAVLDKPLAIDSLGNTFGGVRSPETRSNITQSTTQNTAIGYEALSKVSGGQNNTAIGYQAGKFVVDGNNNVYVGHKTGTRNTFNAIAIGTNLDPLSNEILIGHGDDPIIRGSSSSESHRLNINGFLTVRNSLALEENAPLIFYDKLNIKYSGFIFSNAGQIRTLLPVFEIIPATPETRQPSLDLSLDLKANRKIIFSDSSYLDSASFLNDISNNSDRIDTANSRIDSSAQNVAQLKKDFDEHVIEGIVNQTIRPDELPNSFTDAPLVFYIHKYYKNQSTNRLEPIPEEDNSLDAFELVTLRDPYLNIREGDYVIAIKVNGEYRPISVTGSP